MMATTKIKITILTDRELRTIFNGKKSRKKKDGTMTAGFTVKTTFDAFKSWHSRSNFKNGCWYCGLTNSQSLLLYNLRPLATRGGRRGKRLELDRKEPTIEYDNLENLVWSCYWCNNAKTNFFSELEFSEIGKTIAIKLNEILQHAGKSN